MKTKLFLFFIFFASFTYGQLRVKQSIRYYNAATFDKSPTIPLADGNYKPMPRVQVMDSINAHAGGANSLGNYIVKTATNAPANAQILGSLATGILKNTTATGVLSIAPTSSLSDYISGVDNQVALCKGDSAIDALAAGTNGYGLKMVSGYPAWVEGTTYALLGTTQNTTGQVLIDIPTWSLTLAANKIYEIEVMMIYAIGADTEGVAFGVDYNGGSGASFAFAVTGSLTSTTCNTIQISNFNTPYAGWFKTSEMSGAITMKGWIITGSTSQPLTIMYGKVTSGVVYVFSNSFMKATLIESL